MRLFHILPFLLSLFLGACATTTQPKSKPGMSAYCAEQGKAIMGNRHYEDTAGNQVRLTKVGENRLDAIIALLVMHAQGKKTITACKPKKVANGIEHTIATKVTPIDQRTRDTYAPELLSYFARGTYGEDGAACVSNKRMAIAHQAVLYQLAYAEGCRTITQEADGSNYVRIGAKVVPSNPR